MKGFSHQQRQKVWIIVIIIIFLMCVWGGGVQRGATGITDGPSVVLTLSIILMMAFGRNAYTPKWSHGCSKASSFQPERSGTGDV